MENYSGVDTGAKRGGDAARLYDVPVLSPGRSTIFDRYPPKSSRLVSRSAWAKSQVKAMHAAYASHHGAAFDAYMEGLVGMELSKRERSIKSAMLVYERATKEVQLSSGMDHCRDNFGVLYAGGLMAIRLGVWKLSKKRLLRSLVKCFNSVLITSDPAGELESQAIAKLEQGIKQASWASPDAASSHVRPQFVRFDYEDGRTLLAVEPAAFERWFGPLEHMRTAARHLATTGRLKLARNVDLAQRPMFGLDPITTRARVGHRQHRFVQFFDKPAEPAS